MRVYLNDKSASGLYALFVIIAVVGGAIYLGNSALVALGIKGDPDDRKAKAYALFVASCHEKGGKVIGEKFETPSCYKSKERVPIVSVDPYEAKDSDALVKTSGTWDRKALAQVKSDCKYAVSQWKSSNADDRKYHLDLNKGTPKPRFDRTSGICLHQHG